MFASELFAISQSQRCSGGERCHWCGGPCDRDLLHDDAPILPFVRSTVPALIPSSPYLCRGCWLWRRRRVTVYFFDGPFKDRQCALDHSWWIVPDGAWALAPVGNARLYDLLLKPPPVFCLSLLNGGVRPQNYLQCSFVNKLPGCSAETPVRFTINNVPHEYCVQELEHLLLSGGKNNGVSAGTRELVRLLGPLEKKPLTLEKKMDLSRGRGRPTEEERHSHEPKKTVRASGALPRL